MSADTSVRAQPGEVKKSSWKDFALRMLLGGAITLVAYLVGKQFGPSVAGLFLAFPAIMPASVTLVEQHSGKGRAVNTARGTVAGTVGLLAFGATVWLFADRLSAWQVLLAAAAAWLVVALAGWLALEWLMAGTDDRKTD